MSNINNVEKNFRDKINRLIESKEPFYKSFVNFMNDSSVRTKFLYIQFVIHFMENKDIDNVCSLPLYNYDKIIVYRNYQGEY